MKPTLIRLKTDWREISETPIDAVGDTTLAFWKSGALLIEAAFFDRTTPLDLATVESITLRVRGSQTGGEHLMESTVEAASLNLTLTTDQWNAGTHQHAVFAFTESDTNLDVLADLTSKELWLVLSALQTDGRRVILGAGTIVIHDANFDVAADIDPPDPSDPNLSLGEADSRYPSMAALAAEAAARIAADAALQTNISAKAEATDLNSHTANVGNPHNVTKAQVGLGSVDNTSDADKPVSAAQQTALNAKAATNQKLDDFGVPDDNTDLNATTARHGLLPKLGGGQSNFLRADGTWAAPTGGSTMVSGDCELRGYTDSGHADTPPADLTVEFLSFQAEGYIQFNFNGSDYTVQFATSDPGVSPPTFWADTSWATTVDDLASALYSALSGQVTGITVGNSGAVFTASNSQTGSSATSSVTGYAFSLTTGGGGQGQDAAGPSGEMLQDTVIAASAKTLRPLRVGCFGTGVGVPIQVRLGSEVLGTFAAGVTAGELLINSTSWQGWKGLANVSLYACMVEPDGSGLAPENTPTGGALTIWCMASQ